MKNKMVELKEAATEWNCSIFDAARELIFIYYEAAGVDTKQLDAELDSKTAEEILNMYYDM
jgi:hypothetical protein